MARRHQQVKEGAWVTWDHVSDPHLSFHGNPESTRRPSYPMHCLTGWGLTGARAGRTEVGNVSYSKVSGSRSLLLMLHVLVPEIHIHSK